MCYEHSMKKLFLLSLKLLALFTVEGESLLSGVDGVDIVHSNNHTEQGSKLPKKVNDFLNNELIASNNAAQKLIHKEQANIFETIEESPKTYNVINNAFKAKPVIGLRNYSDQQLEEIRQRYINYRMNVTFPDAENHQLSIKATANDTPYDNDFESWNDRRLKDGLLCHDNVDCKWIDKKLRCDADIELNFNASVSKYVRRKTHMFCLYIF